ncbi:hypothetical protein PoB_003414000 [Plakobranchus ocellatus]|uniref:PID domain-containing protein n=1 Tax=Plakobranchus ocellatus TaxID=259542 RepID=A0AAV4AL93_9GAST|nr:hypothetical protein PoB_003414000 [Plakobranchus ocellatus]
MPLLGSKPQKEKNPPQKEKNPPAEKSHFYVEFLGWRECRGIRGQKHTEPVIKELRRREKSMDRPPKLTIEVTTKELKISQDLDEKKSGGIKKIKFPSIPARDVTYVHQATRPADGRADDIVACIYFGFMPRTGRYVHVHVYRFDEAYTASAFAAKMAVFVKNNMDHTQEMEKELANKGHIDMPQVNSADMTSEPQTTDSAVGSASSGYSDEEESPTFTPRNIEPDFQSLTEVMQFDNVTDELQYRMKLKESPLLLPPIDYNTISRRHGNLVQVDLRRCNEEKIVGEWTAKERIASNESGVDLVSPGSDMQDASFRNRIPDTAALPPGVGRKQVNPPPPPPPPPAKFASKSKTAAHAGSDNATGTNNSNTENQSGHRRQLSTGVPAAAVSPPDPVYPPKLSSPPTSPRLYRKALGNAHNEKLLRQNFSHNDLTEQVVHRQHPPSNSSALRPSSNPNLSTEILAQALQRHSADSKDKPAPPPLYRQSSLNDSSGPTQPFHRQSSSGNDSTGPAQPFNRQNSNSSSGSFRNSQHSDPDRSQEEQKIMYYKGANSEDLYALPFKGPLARSPSAPEDVPPPDYNDDLEEEVNMRPQSKQQPRQPHLTRSMPADLIKSEMLLASNGSRPGSGEFRQVRRTDSPVMRRTDSPAFVGAGRTDSPVVFAPRVDSPSFVGGGHGYAMGGPRVDSPSFMSASQPYIGGDGIGYSPHPMRVGAGKR